MREHVLTMSEAARYLRLNYCTLSRKVKSGEIPAFRVGTKILFRVASLEAWIAGQEAGGINQHTTNNIEHQRGGVLRRIEA